MTFSDDSAIAQATAHESSQESSQEGLKVVTDYLTSVAAWYLATESQGQPHVRPFSFAEIADNHLWFCTAVGKDVYEELTANPRFEACAWKPGSGWVILRGTVTFGEPGPDIRAHGCDHLIALGETYDGPDDPALAFFTLATGEAWLCDIDGSRRLLWSQRVASTPSDPAS